MAAYLFVFLLAAALAALYAWAFRTLPGERWQFLASTPTLKNGDGWRGANFTFYGVFSATAYALGVFVLLTLLGSVGVPFTGSVLLVAAVLAVCAPASNLLAWAIEGKRYGFTIGGAAFVGMFAAPAALAAFNAWLAPLFGYEIPVTPALAALAIVYALGEGVGRLACISFGCCYGMPVEQARGWVRALSERFSFVFEGKTKKAAFASQLDGVRLVPVQAMTATLYAAVALVSIALFYEGLYRWSIPLSLATAHLWRTYSETFRADFRGFQKITAFQIMATTGGAIALAAPWLVPGAAAATPDVGAGLAVVWTPAALLFLEGLWLAAFFYMGRSMQTGAELRYHVHADRI